MGAGHWWLMLVIIATWEAEIRKIGVSGYFEQLICKSPF
jgi:hypothetical protein